jgi:hypothetical protein
VLAKQNEKFLLVARAYQHDSNELQTVAYEALIALLGVQDGPEQGSRVAAHINKSNMLQHHHAADTTQAPSHAALQNNIKPTLLLQLLAATQCVGADHT